MAMAEGKKVASVSGRPGRPKRERKADRLLHSSVTAEEVQCDYALGPFDRLARAMEKKWGVDVLEELVPPEMAAKFGSAMAKLNAALDEKNPELVAARAAVCMRGLEAMDRRATESGAEAASDDVWIVEADGHEFGLLRDARAWQRVQEKYPKLELISDRQMVLALLEYKNGVVREALAQAQKHFPKAEITAIRKKELEDELPF